MGCLGRDMIEAKDLKELLTLLAPGFIILAIRQKFVVSTETKLEDRALSYAAVSAVYYAAIVPWILAAGLKFHWNTTAVAALEYVFIPIALGYAYAWATFHDVPAQISERFGIQAVHHIPTAWDYAFRKLKPSYVLITLKDGRQVPGTYSQGSFTSSSKDERDILLSSLYTLTNGVWSEVQPPRSVLICGKDIQFVEILK
jgi:hypothetical protein